ncbi:ferric reductase-like transmembrane domain-containing protein [Candidatus Saccharibacteria bacterium]|nr:ferric reductase-like transmembrane domain-containing protein [Candidatus Saccharibacteria bacterium]
MSWGYRKILLIVLIISSLVAYLPLLSEPSRLNIGQFIGLVGLQLIWWQIILGDRQINRLFTDDLFWINKIHKFVGKYGFLIIFFHPILMVLSYELNPLSFSTSTTLDKGILIGKVAFSLLAIIWFASAILRDRLVWRWWKRLHLFGYVILPLLLLHAFKVGSDLKDPGLIRLWVSFLAITYGIALTLRLLDWSGFTKSKYKIVKTSLPAKNVTRFQLIPIGEKIVPRRGQFAYFQAKRFGQAHPFTISHFDKKSGELSFSIKAVGPYSSSLANLKVGEVVFIDGPFGIYTRELEKKHKPSVIIAGGIGITPFIRWLQAKKIDYLFYGARTNEDIAYSKVISSSKAKFYKALSEPSSNEKPAFITARFIEKQIDNLVDYDFYVCGPPVMMNKICEELIARKVPKKQIHTERFSL